MHPSFVNNMMWIAFKIVIVLGAILIFISTIFLKGYKEYDKERKEKENSKTPR